MKRNALHAFVICPGTTGKALYFGSAANLRPGYSFTLQPGVLGFTCTGTNVNIHRRAELLLGLFTSTRIPALLQGNHGRLRKW